MKNKFSNFFKNNKYILSSGGAAFFIIIIIYICFEIIPFGDTTVYRMDLYHQYGPLFSEMYDRITSGGSLFYSWNTGLGSPFIGNFLNYLSSPISFIILLFGHENTFEAIGAMIAIKVILSAMSMTYYLSKSQKSSSYFTAAFGVLYAFSGYFIAYYWNVMWIDAMYILPMLALGIEKIINEGKCKMYMLSLAYAIISNYYIAFMLCIFSVVYFLYYYFCQRDEIKLKGIYLVNSKKIDKIKNSFFLHSGFKFAAASFMTACLLAVILIPLAMILNHSSATTGSNPVEGKFYFNIFDFFANHLASLKPTIRSSGEDVLPNVYCGILTIVLLPLYFYSKKIKSSEKTASIVLLSFLYFSFSFNYLNFFWHGFHFPNDLPYRQSFMYSFLLVVLAFKAFKNIGEFDKKHFITIGIALISFIVIVQKIGSKNVIDATIYISISFVLIYIIILGLLISKKSQYFALSVTLLCCVTAESIIASTDHYVANQTKESFAGDYDEFKELQSKVKRSDKDIFYREEISKLRARMDPSWYNYNGVSTFSSMAYEKVANFQKNMGLYGNKINSYTYNPQTPIYNAMFSLKYIYDRNILIQEGDYYSFKDKNNIFTAYENKYPLSIGFPVSQDIINWNASTALNPVDAQDEFFEKATGLSNVISKIYDYEIISGNVMDISDDSKLAESFTLTKISKDFPGSATVDITATNSNNIYIYVYSRNLKDVSVMSPVVDTKMNVNDGYILDLGRYNAGDKISVELPLKDAVSDANIDFTVFQINKEIFETGYNKLKQGQIELNRFNDTEVEGTFTAESDEILYTSIPYDKGWAVYIDDKKVDDSSILAISDALIGIKVTEGQHTIRLKYTVPCLAIGLVISIISFLVLIIFILILKKVKIENIWQKAEKNKEASQKNLVEEVTITFDNPECSENNE